MADPVPPAAAARTSQGSEGVSRVQFGAGLSWDDFEIAAADTPLEDDFPWV